MTEDSVKNVVVGFAVGLGFMFITGVLYLGATSIQFRNDCEKHCALKFGSSFFVMKTDVFFLDDRCFCLAGYGKPAVEVKIK